jgi:hypothetical protein
MSSTNDHSAHESVDTGSVFPALPKTFIAELEDVMPPEIVDLPPLLDHLASLVAETPETSWFLANVDPPAPRWEGRPSTLKDDEFELATYLWDIHSMMCGHYLHILWRTDQLSRSAAGAFSAWDLVSASALTRGLIESAAVFTIEHTELLSVWARARKSGFASWKDVADFHSEAGRILTQMVMGTRQPELLEIGRLGDVLTRKNVLTFLKKAAKTHDYSQLVQIYDTLSDAVHPSMGANAVFWTKQDGLQDPAQLHWHLARRAARWSPAPQAIAKGLVWSLQRLLNDLAHFREASNDSCLSAKISHLEGLNYFGFIPNPNPYAQCPCGSGKKAKFCQHALAIED